MIITAIIAASVALAAPAGAQDHQHGETAGSAGNGQDLRETGQSAFAAIAEVTTRLNADPTTAWADVRIDLLRQHLVDMDNVTLRTDVVSKPVPGGARFEVTGADSRVRASIDRIVRMHAGMVGEENGLTARVAGIRNGTALTVTGNAARSEDRIRGLGFYGVLTEGVHHQRHHLAIARGQMRH